MRTRALSPDDVAAVARLRARVDTYWFGAPESDEAETAEELARVASEHGLLVVDGDRLVGALWWWSTTGTVLVDPAAADSDAVIAVSLDFAERIGVPEVHALSRDERLRAALDARGWRHTHSGFDLLRPVSDDWTLPAPHWPAGVALAPFASLDPHDVHELIYVAAEWSAVPGHVTRPLAEWRSIFLDPVSPDLHLVAARGDRLVGVALGRIFADGTGWLAQLAVARADRGHGLGRALLLAALRHYRTAGATVLGLGVEAENATALRLYEGVGLRIDREWQTFAY
ncbi:Acetyltransferase (GNAT) family protein [Jatrophihabitans endophyticus]|uniref:Acetyltransferase (GNAT) family protein n=1 Tax=Jatrophihabitans endophyticus TaxID=1206085 RepID=A0A1M5CYG1_9ACTN|nr:GNAT family N-acetyltransferase [Jatrophihabitans endophyticus]SHF59674.1 Acetyltransferase (GNAT) family protein [Jatrophihabitans endophyticus]